MELSPVTYAVHASVGVHMLQVLICACVLHGHVSVSDHRYLEFAVLASFICHFTLITVKFCILISQMLP